MTYDIILLGNKLHIKVFYHKTRIILSMKFKNNNTVKSDFYLAFLVYQFTLGLIRVNTYFCLTFG